MSSVSSWLPVALVLEGFSVSLLFFVSESLTLLPLLPVHLTLIFLDPFSLPLPKRHLFSHVFLETLQQKKKKAISFPLCQDAKQPSSKPTITDPTFTGHHTAHMDNMFPLDLYQS